MTTYRLATVNLGSRRDEVVLHGILGLLERHDAVGVQEAGDRGGVLAEVGRITGCRVLRGDGDGRSKVALLVASHVPVLDWGYFGCTPATEVGPFGAGPETISAKWIVWADLGDLVVGCTHKVPSVQRPPFPGRARRRALYAEHVARDVAWAHHWREQGRQPVLVGDFNATPRYFQLDPLRAVLRLHSRPSFGVRPIDYIAVSDAVTAAEVAALDFPSDHRAVSAVVTTPEVPPMANRYPKGSWEPLGRQSESRMTSHDIVCIHTMVGSLAGTDTYFDADGYGGTESHFGTGGAGEKVKQWQDLAFTADANLNGNHRVISIENADKGPGFPQWTGSNVPGFTDAQLEQLVDLVAWLCSKEAHSACPADWKCHQEGIPARIIPDSKPGRRGIGYHRQGIDGSLPDMRVEGGEVWSESTGKICPGDRRVQQTREILVPRVAKRLAPDPTPRWDAIWEQASAILANAEGRSVDEVEDAQRVKRLAARNSTKH